MSLPLISEAPDPPLVTDNAATFNTKAFGFIAWMAGAPDEFNALAEAMETLAQSLFNGTSTTSNTIAGSGSKSFTTQAGLAFSPGQAIIAARTSAPSTTYMRGTVTSYDAVTGALVMAVTNSLGSGTYTDWSIGLVADSATLAGYVTLAGSETLTNKTLTAPAIANPVLTGTPTTDIFAITDGGSVSIDPANGEVQTWTLGANRTPTLSLITAGKAVLLMIDDGTAYTLTLSGVTWLNNDGLAPDLKTSGYTPILLFNVGGTLYAWLCGDQG